MRVSEETIERIIDDLETKAGTFQTDEEAIHYATRELKKAIQDG